MLFADEFVRELEAAGAPEEPDPAVLGGLLEAYRSAPTRERWCGDPARDAVILQLALPVFRLVLRHRTRNNAYDLLGEAFLTLVECVDRWPGVDEDGNIRKYVEFCVRKRIKDYIDADKAFMMPPRRAREKRACGEEVPRINIYGLDVHDPDAYGEEGSAPSEPPDESFDVQEFFRSREDGRDQVLAEMRIMGRPVEEIAARIGQKKSWVYKRLRDLEQAWACEVEAAVC